MSAEHTVNLKGKEHLLYPGLLDRAHHMGLRGIDTDLVQIPTDENGNVAIVKAMVVMGEEEHTYSGYGDASPANVGRGILPHIIRMAETRAKGRALRDAVNIGGDELDELEAETQPAVNEATPIREAQRAPEVEPHLDSSMEELEELYFGIPVEYRPKPPWTWEKIRQEAMKGEKRMSEAIEWLSTYPGPDS